MHLLAGDAPGTLPKGGPETGTGLAGTRTAPFLTNTRFAPLFANCAESPQLMTKWFSLQALSSLPDTVERVRSLSQHPDYNPLVPNFVRSLVSTFMNSNPAAFHRKDGAGYELAFDFLKSMDKINPRTGARAAAAFSTWERYDEGRRAKMRSVLDRLARLPNVSRDLRDVVEKALRLAD